uniref:Replication protein A subunit n=1 Tax=Takifugu rubripes TaxID=31033 RepID=A0A674MVP2_TAKRU
MYCGGNGLPRFRVMMSDGRHTLSSFMLSTQLNYLIEENTLSLYCICVLKRHVTNILKDGRRVVIILEIDVIKRAEEVAGRIGDPTPYTESCTHRQPQSLPPCCSPLISNRYLDLSAVFCFLYFKTVDVVLAVGKMFHIGQEEAELPSLLSCSIIKHVGPESQLSSVSSVSPRWTIRARVTNKSSIRTWSNSRGDGKLFTVELVDESGEIRMTAFNQEVDKFFGLIEAGKVYYISKCSLKIANKQYTSVKNDYEMTLNGESSIVPCEDSCDVPMVQCDFVSIGDLENKEKDSIVDVIGVCKKTDEATHFTSKSNREMSKRTLHLIDISGKLVTVTLWGEEAEKFDGSGEPIIAIKGAKLSDFGGCSLSASFSSTLMVNPDIPEAHKLRGWYDKEGHSMEGQSLTEMRSGGGGGNTNWKTLTDVKTEHLGHGEKADYYTCIATIVYLRKENCLYQACPSQDCNKKVVDQQNGMFRCEKCDKEFPNFKYRLILSANIADYGDNQWVTCFQESAEAILGQNAAYLGQLKESNEAAFDEVFQQANFNSFIFRSRVKLETYNDESRIKATVMEVKPVDHKDYSKRLIMNIRKLVVQ